MNKLTLSLILLFSYYGSQAATILSTPVFQKSSYLTYEKAEAGFTIDFDGGNYSNPFDSSVVTVDALITLPDNSIITVPCFYFIPATFASAGINWWDGTENVAGAKWLLRYAPKTGGTHTVTIRVIDANGTVTSSPVSFLAVAPSVGGPKGFVRTDATNNQFMRFENGTPYYPVGENLAWQTPGTLVQFYNTYLDNLGDNKATWIRYWLTGFARQALEWKLTWSDWYNGGLEKYSQRAAALLDSVVYNCERKGIYMQLVLQQHGQFSTVVDSNWPDNPYNSANPGGYLSNPCEFFTNAAAIAQTKKQYRYIVARCAYSSNILAWELFNEVHFAGGSTPCTPSDVVNWHKTMSDYLKSIDINKHMVTTSADNTLLTLMDGGNTSLDNLQYHTYASAPIEQTMVANAVANKAAFTKPVLCGEFGVGNTTVASVAGDLWADHIRKPMWTGFFNEVPAMYWYWDSTYMQRKNLYNVFNPISTFLEGVDIVAETGGNSGNLKFALNPSLTTNLSAVPGLSWATSTQKDFVMDGSGNIAGLDKLSSYLQGPWNAALGTYASFTVNYASAGTATINVSGVSTATGAGSATVSIFVDGVSKASGNFSTAGALVAQVPAGTHVIRFERTTGGNDWVNISNYSFTPIAIEKCLAYGFHGTEKAYGYVFDKSLPEWQNPGTATAIATAQIRIGSLTAGNYRVDYFDPQAGTSFTPGDVYETINDSITIHLPSFKKDLAFKVYSTTDPVTSIFDPHQDKSSTRVSLYPNPAYNEINVTVNSAGESKSTLSVYNLIGKEVLAQEVNLVQGANVFNLDISSLPSSLYFIRVGNAGKVNGNLKFIKK
jgi:hypothetical protein